MNKHSIKIENARNNT